MHSTYRNCYSSSQNVARLQWDQVLSLYYKWLHTTAMWPPPYRHTWNFKMCPVWKVASFQERTIWIWDLVKHHSKGSSLYLWWRSGFKTLLWRGSRTRLRAGGTLQCLPVNINCKEMISAFLCLLPSKNGCAPHGLLSCVHRSSLLNLLLDAAAYTLITTQ